MQTKRPIDRGVGNVVRLFPHKLRSQRNETPTLVEQLEHLLHMAMTGQIDNMMVVCYNSDSEVMTGYVNLTPRERIALQSYLQVELIGDVMSAQNYD